MSNPFAKLIVGMGSMAIFVHFFPLLVSINKTTQGLDLTVADNMVLVLITAIGIMIIGLYGFFGIYLLIGFCEDLVPYFHEMREKRRREWL